MLVQYFFSLSVLKTLVWLYAFVVFSHMPLCAEGVFVINPQTTNVLIILRWNLLIIVKFSELRDRNQQSEGEKFNSSRFQLTNVTKQIIRKF